MRSGEQDQSIPVPGKVRFTFTVWTDCLKGAGALPDRPSRGQFQSQSWAALRAPRDDRSTADTYLKPWVDEVNRAGTAFLCGTASIAILAGGHALRSDVRADAARDTVTFTRDIAPIV